MAIAGIITATVFVMFFFAFELWGTITKKDWVIIASYGFRICFLLDLICITVILHLSGILSRYTYNKLGIWFFISNCWVTSKNSIHKCLRSTFVLREMIQCLCKKNTQVVFLFFISIRATLSFTLWMPWSIFEIKNQRNSWAFFLPKHSKFWRISLGQKVESTNLFF